MVVFPPPRGQHRLHLLAGLQLDQIDQQHPPPRAAGVVGRFVHIQRIHPPLVREKQQLVVRVDHLQLHQHIIIPVAGAAHPLAAPFLVAVSADRHPLNVPPLAQRYHHILLDDELLNGLLLQLARLNVGAARVGVLALELPRFPLDFGPDFLRVLQQILQPGDGRQQVVVFLVQLLPFQRGQPAQLHIQDGLRLDFSQVKLLHQVVARRFHILAAPDGFNDGVNGVQRFQQPLHNVRPVPRPPQLVLRAPPDDLLPMRHKVRNQVFQRQFLRLPVHQRQHYGVESGTQRRPLVQIVEDDRRLGVAVQLNHHPDAPPVGFVPDFGNAHQRLVPHQAGDFLHQIRLVDLIGQFRDDDALPIVAGFLNLGNGLHNDAAPPGGVHIPDAGHAPDARRRRKVRPRHQCHQLIHIAVGMVNHMADGIADFAQIVRRHIGSHTDGDARRPVDQQVGHPGRQHPRLLDGIVKVVAEINGLLVNVGQHFVGDGGQTRLGVAHGRRRVAVHAAEVPLPVNQRRPH